MREDSPIPAGSPYIPDGYTLAAHIAGTDAPPHISIEYRPMRAADRRILAQRVAFFDSPGDAISPLASHLVAAEISCRLVSWTLTDALGTLMPLSAGSVASLPENLLTALAAIVLGLSDQSKQEETADEQNLVDGVRLLQLAPHVADRNCQDCLQYVYDEETGLRALHAGLPIARPAGTSAPCRLPQIGCPNGTPEKPRRHSERNHQAYRFDLECRMTSSYPYDPLVRRHAILIRSAETGSAHSTAARGQEVS